MEGRQALIILALVAGCRSQTANCGATTNGETGSSLPPCEQPQPVPVIPDQPSDVAGPDMFGNSGTYFFIIIVGVVAIPVMAVIRICWTKKLYGRSRHIHREEGDRRPPAHHRGDLFTIDMDTSEFPKIPTYEEAIVSPDTGCPPAYDKIPPCYADVLKTKEKEPQPSTSTGDCGIDVCLHV